MLSRSRHLFFGFSALLFVASAAVTIHWSMAMREMTMPGGMGSAMPGQDWPGAAGSFLAMWMVMMAAMMLPSLAPALWRYREAAGEMNETDAGRMMLLAAAGYFFVWLLFGVAVFPLGPAVTAIEIEWPSLAGAVPATLAGLITVAGLLQFTQWKAHHLACCRGEQGTVRLADAGTAWRHGVRLGLHCSVSSIGPTAILLAVGMMDLRAMALVTAAITAERVAPDGERVARLIGIILVVVGLFLLARASG
jgi:predicted metal-binding membrane protein